ncbi:hypothetical protein ES703_09110 [subsurface metagenome]
MSWEQLGTILKENRKIAKDEKAEPITKCPDCAYGPLKERENGDKCCPICGWRGR